MSETPATERGTTVAAGADVDDAEMVREVAGQTDPDLAVSDVFEREADGTSVDTEIAKASADEIAEDGQ